jgi:hypothetical protein
MPWIPEALSFYVPFYSKSWRSFSCGLSKNCCLFFLVASLLFQEFYLSFLYSGYKCYENSKVMFPVFSRGVLFKNMLTLGYRLMSSEGKFIKKEKKKGEMRSKKAEGGKKQGK